MTSLDLANKVWAEIKNYSVSPCPDRLDEIVVRLATDAERQGKTILLHVAVPNAKRLVAKRMAELDEAHKLWRKIYDDVNYRDREKVRDEVEKRISMLSGRIT